MNKYKDAYDNIWLDINQGTISYYEELGADLKILGELVEKATPMNIEAIKLDKSVVIGKTIFCKGTTFLSKCPKCGAWLHPHYHKQYCGTCGQKLDWSEDD